MTPYVYDSKKRMLLSAESRSSVILPDILPLPSLLSEAVGHSPDSQLPVSALCVLCVC